MGSPMCTVPIRPDSKDEIANRSYPWPYPEMYPYVVEDKEPSHYVLNYNETRGLRQAFSSFQPRRYRRNKHGRRFEETRLGGLLRGYRDVPPVFDWKRSIKLQRPVFKWYLNQARNEEVEYFRGETRTSWVDYEAADFLYANASQGLDFSSHLYRTTGVLPYHTHEGPLDLLGDQPSFYGQADRFGQGLPSGTHKSSLLGWLPLSVSGEFKPASCLPQLRKRGSSRWQSFYSDPDYDLAGYQEGWLIGGGSLGSVKDRVALDSSAAVPGWFGQDLQAFPRPQTTSAAEQTDLGRWLRTREGLIRAYPPLPQVARWRATPAVKYAWRTLTEQYKRGPAPAQGQGAERGVGLFGEIEPYPRTLSAWEFTEDPRPSFYQTWLDRYGR